LKVIQNVIESAMLKHAGSREALLKFKKVFLFSQKPKKKHE